MGKGVLLYNRRDIFKWALQERSNCVLIGICNVASKEGKIDVLEEMWNNIDDEDDKEDVFRYVNRSAACVGKLNVLKWFETKGLYFNKNKCAKVAARNGQLQILEWLREQGLELNWELYDEAIKGDHLRVMKWLREQEFGCYRYTFYFATRKGNLDILQWLHDEGYPWHHNVCVDELCLKPEVVQWLRANGYSGRLITF